MTSLTLGSAINAGLSRALEGDEKVLLMGEDIGKLGGVFRVTDGLQQRFGAHRVVDTPLAEAGIVGTAVGLALRGYRPVVEIQFDGFVYPAFDQIVCQVAKLHYRSNGRIRMPLVIRIPWAGGVGAAEHHSESPEAYFVHTAGLRVVAASNPQDAYVMLRQAIASDAQVRTALDAALAAEDEGISLEVIDLRSLSPIDMNTVAASVRKTGRVVVTHEAAREAGVGAELVASITEQCFHYLEAPPQRVTGHDIPYPPSKLEKHHVPDLDRILHAVDRVRERGAHESAVETSGGGVR